MGEVGGVSEDDRDEAFDRLSAALDRGVLSVEEFDRRANDIELAVTPAELDRALGDLDALATTTTVAAVPTTMDVERRYRVKVRRELAGWIGTNGVCTGIWVVMGGHGAFWPVWPLMFSTVGLIGLFVRGAEGDAEEERRKALKKTPRQS